VRCCPRWRSSEAWPSLIRCTKPCRLLVVCPGLAVMKPNSRSRASEEVVAALYAALSSAGT